ncbi:unnamed protein product [Rhizophagus irregularis]|nr:unnamed protein product [Rhizophagus irregularis]
MVILNYRSPYLRRILSTNKKKNDETFTHQINKYFTRNFSNNSQYIYSGKLALKDYDTSDIIKILIAASELNLRELMPHLQTFLIKNKSDWMEQNFSLVCQMSIENDPFLDLQNFCTELISKQPGKIFKSLNFTLISEKTLISVIRRDNLPIEHSFHQIYPKEFLNQIIPYEKVMPRDGQCVDDELKKFDWLTINSWFFGTGSELVRISVYLFPIRFLAHISSKSTGFGSVPKTALNYVIELTPSLVIPAEELFEYLIGYFLDNQQVGITYNQRN